MVDSRHDFWACMEAGVTEQNCSPHGRGAKDEEDRCPPQGTRFLSPEPPTELGF